MGNRLMFFIVSLFVGFIMCAETKKPQTIDEAFDLFDEVIEQRDLYVTSRYNQINKLKDKLSKDITQLECYEVLGDEFKGVNIDSAIYYYTRGYELSKIKNDSVWEQRFRLHKAAILPVQGVVKESVEEYESVVSDSVFEANEELFYELGNRLYFYVSSFYPNEELSRSYVQKGVSSTDSLLLHLEKDTSKYKLYAAQAAFMAGDMVTAAALLDDLMDAEPINSNMFARASNMQSSIARTEEESLFYLMLSAISDIVCGTLEGASLQELGVRLFERGDIDRAYIALTTALDNAVESGARIRALESSQAIPVIAQTFRAKDLRKMWWLGVLVVCLILTLVGIVIVMVYLNREKKKHEILGLRLAKSNYAKETYISQFLNLCSLYMDKLEDFNRLAGRKIAAGQVEELHAMIKDRKVLTAQNNLFYEMFDEAFMNIYPSFVSDVNDLLCEDKQFSLPDKPRLNMELRILAFMRLGIVDSAKIAKFLSLSLNTIYAYRNKMRNRAKNRETFEEQVQKIGKIA